MKFSSLSFASFLVFASKEGSVVFGGCPFAQEGGNVPNPHTLAANDHSLRVHKTPLVQFKIPPKERTRKLESSEEGSSQSLSYSNQNVGDGYAIPEGGYDAVRKDVVDMVLTANNELWPADFNDQIATPDTLTTSSSTGATNGNLFIRLAWHCNGTYRISDGRGGCDGADMRFPPVSRWADNASLQVAIELLKPVKEKHGDRLSWGDLIALAAEASLQEMGFQTLGFCGGRIDHTNGDEMLPLGPSQIQQTLLPCGDEQCPEGQVCPGCEAPLGAAAVGLIYVDPVGTPEGDFDGTAQNIKEVFARMGFDDRETVSSIGGAHAFGKCHGACKAEDRIDVCSGVTVGDRTVCHTFCPNPLTGSKEPPYLWQQKVTSGLEVTWTEQPNNWDNTYFRNIFFYPWEEHIGPGGAMQWRVAESDGNGLGEVVGPFAPKIEMLTTDLALGLSNYEPYTNLSIEYATSFANLTRDFQASWYRLLASDTGPRTRCLGDEGPPLQPWEKAINLGPLTTNKPNYIPVRSAIQASIDKDPSNIAAFTSLAVKCASTFRATDYSGGCNGAAIRFSPSIDWESNKGVAKSLELLEPISQKFPDVSMADLIVLAGQTAVEAAGGKPIPFCGGRVDADNGDKSIGLEPRIFNNNTYASILYDIANKGMGLAEGVALMAEPASNSDDNGSSYVLSSAFFATMKESLDEDEIEWYKDHISDMAEEFINNNEYFLEQYTSAYNYLMTADLFDGPTKNACQGVSDPTLEGQTNPPMPIMKPSSEEDMIDFGEGGIDSNTHNTGGNNNDGLDSSSSLPQQNDDTTVPSCTNFMTMTGTSAVSRSAAVNMTTTIDSSELCSKACMIQFGTDVDGAFSATSCICEMDLDSYALCDVQDVTDSAASTSATSLPPFLFSLVISVVVMTFLA